MNVSMKLAQPMHRSMATAATGYGGLSFAVKNAAGIKVACRDDGRPTTSLSVVIKAGSRYEQKPGVAHVLEKFAFKSTEKRTALRITRETELIGASLTSSISREHIVLNAQFLREDLPYFTELLGEVVSKTKYAKYVLPETALPLARYDYESFQHSPPALASDLVHGLAFRRGLGNTLLSTPESTITIDEVTQHVKRTYVKDNMVVIATGADESELTGLVSKHFADVPAGPAVKDAGSKYYGGETRLPYKSPTAHFVMGFPGAAAAPATPAEYTVLSHLLGGTSSIKWTLGNSVLSNVASEFGKNTKSIANYGAYSDTGLFSVYVMGPTSAIKGAASASIQALKSVSKETKQEDLKRAIAQAKLALYAAAEERTLSAETVGQAILLSGSTPNISEMVKDLENVTAEKIQKTAAKLLESKPSVVAVGETHLLPYFDELN